METVQIKTSNSDKTILIDKEDFEKINKYKWSTFCDKKRSPDTFYAISTTKPHIKMHRLILNISDPKIIIDHINRNGIDNRKLNLRTCTHSENKRNSIKVKNSKGSLYKGVVYNKTGRGKKRWRVRITINNKRISLGRYFTEIEAAVAYNNAAQLYHGNFALLNNIIDSQ